MKGTMTKLQSGIIIPYVYQSLDNHATTGKNAPPMTHQTQPQMYLLSKDKEKKLKMFIKV
jgi:hypothetical protein